MAIGYVNAQSQALGFASALNIAVPSGSAAGDLMIAGMAWNSAATVSAVPSGWALIASATSQAWYWKIAVGSEAASYQWTLSAGASAGAMMLLYRGVAASPIGASATAASTLSGSTTTPTVTLPTITPTAAGLELMLVCKVGNEVAGSGWTFPAGDVRLSPQGNFLGGAADTPAVAGVATGTRAISYSQVPAFGALRGLHLAIYELAAGGSAPFGRPFSPALRGAFG